MTHRTHARTPRTAAAAALKPIPLLPPHSSMAKRCDSTVEKEGDRKSRVRPAPRLFFFALSNEVQEALLVISNLSKSLKISRIRDPLA